MVTQDYLNGQSAAILVVFVFVSFFVIWPVRIPLFAPLQRAVLSLLCTLHIIDDETRQAYSIPTKPKPTTPDQDSGVVKQRRLYFPISLETAPVIGVILLLACTTIDGSTIKLGVKGDENVKPYDVLVLFISLAYIAIALDGTGALEAVAFWVSKRGGNSGPRLFAYLYIFFLLTGCIVGNDPLILSGTPFLAYLTKYTEFEPTAWIFSEFMAANTASAVLVSSNPTNILIAGSFQLNFLTGFTKWTVLPSVIPGILNYFVLWFMFKNKIPKHVEPLEGDPWSKLRDRVGATYLSVLMVVTICVLVGTSFVPGQKVEVWMVTAPAGVMALAYEFVVDWIDPAKQRDIVHHAQQDLQDELERVESRRSVATAKKSRDEKEPTVPMRQVSSADIAPTLVNEKQTTDMDSSKVANNPASAAHSDASTLSNDRMSDPDYNNKTTSKNATASPAPQSKPPIPTTLQSLFRATKHRFPRTTRTIAHLPIPLLPFAICQFILIRGLAQRGWITTFASGFIRATPNPTASVFFYGFISAAFLCPFAGTNIGATILLVEILRSDVILQSDLIRNDPRILLGAIYATALGSNLGAFSYVFAASLAGLLWKGLLEPKGIKVSQLQFCLVNLGPLVVQSLVACAIIVGEVYWFT